MRRVAASSPPPPNPACHRPLPVFALPAPAGAAPLPAGIASAPSDRRRAFLLPPQSHVGLGSPPANRTVLSWSSFTGRIQTLCPRPRTGLRRTDLQTVTPLVGRFGHDEPQGGPIRQGRGLSPPVTLLSASRSSRNVHPSAHGVRPWLHAAVGFQPNMETLFLAVDSILIECERWVSAMCSQGFSLSVPLDFVIKIWCFALEHVACAAVCARGLATDVAGCPAQPPPAAAMGNSQPSPPSSSNTRFAMASRAFSKQELDGLRALFVSLAAQSQTRGRAISRAVFLEYFGVRGTLGDRLFQMVARESGGDDGVTFEGLIVSKATYERGTRDEVDEFIYKLCDVTGDGILSRSDLDSILASIHETIFTENKEAGEGSEKRASEAFLNSATFSKDTEGVSGKFMSLSDFRNWCTLMPSLRKFLGSMLMPPDSGRPGSQVPLLHYPENISSDLLLLNKEYAWHIGGGFSQQEAQEWKLLYHSSLHGQSFNTFLGNVTNGDAHTVLIVKDTEGFIYGGYASQPWERHSDFYGDMKTFLYKLYPEASIFRPTGANKNLQWCAINFSSDNIPNGIGFGGQPHHFGLFLSASFDQGHSFHCTTFTSPPLSKTNRFRPEVIECWGIQVRGARDEKQELVKGTVLERFKEDRNMLKMVGLASASD